MVTGWAVVLTTIGYFGVQACSAAQERDEQYAAKTADLANEDYTGFYRDICETRGACPALLMVAQGVGDGREAMEILTRYTFTDGIANDTAVNAAVGRFGMQVLSGTKYGRQEAAKELLNLLAVDSPGYQL